MATTAAVYSLGAAALAVGLVALLHVLEPEFDPSWRMLSEYSLGHYGVLMRLAFIAAGTGVIAVAVALWGSAGWMCLGLILVATGPLAAAFIDTDPITTPVAEQTRRSKVHAAVGSLFILGFPLAATLAGIGAGGSSTVGPILAWASVVPWIALGWFVASLRDTPADGRAAPDIKVGWPNRVCMLAYLAWMALAAVVMLR
jgi:Protein of unknown function (DUF998)